MNFIDFLPIRVEGELPASQTQSESQSPPQACSPMEASSTTSTEPSPTPGSTSTEGPDIAFPMPSRAVMLLVRPRRPRRTADRPVAFVSETLAAANDRSTMTRSMSLSVPNSSLTHPRRTLSFSRPPVSSSQRTYGLSYLTPSGQRSSTSRHSSGSPSEDPDNQKAMNTLLAAHNLELVASRSPTPSTTSPRLLPRFYVKPPHPPMHVPEESDGELPVRIRPRSQVSEASSSNPMDTMSVSPRAPSASSFPTEYPPSCPNIPLDMNKAQAYTILGTLDPDTRENTFASPSPDQHPDQGLRIMKIMSKRCAGELAAERELNVLKWLSEISEDVEQRAKYQMAGFNFLQKMTTSFQNSELTFIILDHHPAPLTHPEIISRLRIQPSNLPAGGRSSILPPVTLSPNQSIPARLRALRLLSAELVLGLLFLHDNGIVHQDITPANIMISATGHAIIGEFGAARRLPVLFPDRSPSGSQGSPNRSSSLRYGPVVRKQTESPAFISLYAAPEFIEMNSNGMLVYDEAIDFWSLGVLLYEIATGSHPFINDEGECSNAGDVVKSPTSQEATKGLHVLFEIFARELLIRNPQDRLRGSIVKDHIFFAPISGIWEDIASLKHPPLPRPLSHYTPLVQNRLLSLPKPASSSQDPHPTRSPVLVPRSILKRRTPQHVPESDNPSSLRDADKHATIVEESIPGEERSGKDEAVCSDCTANIPASDENSSPSAVSDSEIVIPDDFLPFLDHAHSECDTPKSSSSFSILTPMWDSRLSRPSDVDEELLTAAQTCFHLEEYLSTGVYFNDPNDNPDPHVAQETMQLPVSFPAIRSRPSSEVSDDFHQHYEVQKESLIEVTPRETLRQPSLADAANWSFENEITMAVLDAMDKQSRSPDKDEFGIFDPFPDQTTSTLSKVRRTEVTIRRTFAKFRRRIGSP